MSNNNPTGKNSHTDEELREALDAYHASAGNKSAAARHLGLDRHTFRRRLQASAVRFKVSLGKVADGRVEAVSPSRRPLPKRGCVRRYVLTSAQNNTHVHPAFDNLLTYVSWLDGLRGSSCELLVGTFSYQLDAYGSKSVKRGSKTAHEAEAWYDPVLEPYIADASIQLAPGLVWCGEMNILPTARHPLSGLEEYNGRQSNIVPHAKIAMESIASLQDEATKFNYSTGAVTQRNYIKKRAGIVAEQGHSYGASLVEVDDAGNWWVRQLTIDDRGEIYDVGPRGHGPVKVAEGGLVVEGPEQAVVEAISWGDLHAAEMELWVRELAFGDGGMLDALRPRKQFAHDVFSMRSRSHHEARDFHRTYAKHVTGEDSVEGEVQVTADLLADVIRPWCTTYVVPSNHDRHLMRWLNEADPRLDVLNARYHSELQASVLGALDAGHDGFNVLEHALKRARPDLQELEGLVFLGEEESLVVCRDRNGGVECALHGDLGPNGSRGSTRNLTRLGRAVNKGHDHTAAIRDRVYSAGACSLSFPYMKGPTAHSISHIVTFENGARQIITMWDGRWRA